MPKTWRFAPHDESLVGRLSRELRIAPLTARVLVGRGYQSPDKARSFLHAPLADLHEPETLPGAAEAADRIVAAVKAGRRVTIYGDYDVDGVTATSLLWYCLKLAGANVDYYIPCRFEEGYGLNADALRELHEADPNRMVVTVDCGIASVEEAALASQFGLELIVTDHHRPAETLPEAAGVVHPRLPGTDYPFPDLCGAGVAFKLAWAICQRLGDGTRATPRMREFLKSAVGLAAVGTVADVVPLTGENRILVRYGLGSLAQRSTLGLEALKKIAGLDGQKTLDSEDIGFALAPRINAAGRLGQARLAVELLTTENKERAVALADYLNQLNDNRKKVERRIFRKAKEMVAENGWDEAPALVLAHPEWHPGVVGIVANRVAEHFEKPTVLIALDKSSGLGQGSGRSFADFNLHAGLAACAEHLEAYGGHHAAAGLKIDADRIDAFREALCAHVGANHEVADHHREYHIDAEVALSEVTRRAVLELDRLGPFGAGNDRPVFAATDVELAQPPRKMGEGDRHLDLRVCQFGTTLRAVAFGRGEWADEIAAADGPVSIGFAPCINRFRGQENVELRLIDWQA